LTFSVLTINPRFWYLLTHQLMIAAGPSEVFSGEWERGST